MVVFLVMAKKPTLREQLDQEQADHAETTEELRTLIEIIRRHHDDTHPEVFRYCDNPVCKEAGLFEFEPESRSVV